MTTTNGLTVSVTALLGLLQRHNLGEPHPVLAHDSPRGSPRASQSQHEQLAVDGFDDRDRHDRVRTALDVACRAQVEVYGWITHDDHTATAVLVAAIGRITTVLARTGDQVRIGHTDHRQLPDTVVRHLPDVPPARAGSLTIREADYTEATTRPAGSVLRRSPGHQPEDVRRLNHLLKAPRRSGALLYTATRALKGVRHRSAEWINVLDLPDGRWAVYGTVHRGERAITAVPGTRQLLTTKLDELAHTAGTGR